MVPTATHGISDGDCVSCYIDEILSCYSELAQSPSLEPSPKVNVVFDRLVRLCTQVPDEEVTAKVRLIPSCSVVS